MANVSSSPKAKYKQTSFGDLPLVGLEIRNIRRWPVRGPEVQEDVEEKDRVDYQIIDVERLLKTLAKGHAERDGCEDDKEQGQYEEVPRNPCGRGG